MNNKQLLLSQEGKLDFVCLRPFLFKVGPRIPSSSITWEFVQNAASWTPSLDVQNQNPHFNTVPLYRATVYTLKFEKPCNKKMC